MFTLSCAAARQIQQAASDSGVQEMALRIAAKLDADGSMQYGMGFDQPNEDDIQLELEGVAVVIGREFHELLDDAVLDYVELTPGEFNFIFSHSRETQTATESGASCVSPGCASTTCGAGSCGSTGRSH
jgi:iron-sulfur cluster assembly protein